MPAAIASFNLKITPSKSSAERNSASCAPVITPKPFATLVITKANTSSTGTRVLFKIADIASNATLSCAPNIATKTSMIGIKALINPVTVSKIGANALTNVSTNPATEPATSLNEGINALTTGINSANAGNKA